MSLKLGGGVGWWDLQVEGPLNLGENKDIFLCKKKIKKGHTLIPASLPIFLTGISVGSIYRFCLF